MRIWKDTLTSTIILEGTKTIFPSGTLQSTISMDRPNSIEIWMRAESIRIVGPLHFSNIEQENGNTFDSLDAAMLYIEEILAYEQPASSNNVISDDVIIDGGKP